MDGMYHLVAIAVAVWGVVSGYRRGILRLSGKVLAVAFGIVAARMFAESFLEDVNGWLPDFITGFSRGFLARTVTCGAIYLVVMGVVELLTLPLGPMMRVLGSGVINSIAGAAFRAFQFLMIVSLAYNLIADLRPAGSLARSSGSHDGNVVEGVMMIAPAVLDFPGGEDIRHQQQLEDAKKIS